MLVALIIVLLVVRCFNSVVLLTSHFTWVGFVLCDFFGCCVCGCVLLFIAAWLLIGCCYGCLVVVVLLLCLLVVV